MDFDGGRTVQRFPADDLIRANGQAEAAELSRTRERLRESDEMMQEIRRINLKTVELQEKMEQRLARIEELAQISKTASEGAADTCSKVLEQTKNAGDNTDKISAMLTEKLAQIPDPKEEIVRLGANIEDVIHKEDVKVYKNVQASIDKAIEDQTKKLTDEMTEIVEDTVPGNKGLYVLLILTFITSLANLGIWIADYLGFLAY